MNKDNLTKISMVVGIILSVTLIINTSLSAYVLYTSSFQASMSDAEESLDIAIRTDTGRPTILEELFNSAKNWITSYYVGGTESTNAETGITISVTGSNVASQATVSYYIEGVPQSGGHAYRFLEGNGTAITVGGSSLSPTNQTTIENHLEAMGLSTTASHTIDYYVYVVAQATGVVSGETLTTEITRTLFDTVSYQYGNVASFSRSCVEADFTDEYASGFTTGTYTKAGEFGIHNYTARYTFDDININSADFSNVTLKVQEDKISGEEDTAYLSIRLWDESPASNPNPSSYTDFWSHPYTAEEVSWTITEEWLYHNWYNSPNLATAAQEVIDRGDWTSGDCLTVVLINQGGGSGEAFRQIETNAATLYLEYIYYSASWYEIPPLSITSLPVTMDLAAVLSVIIATLVVVKIKMEEKNK